MDRPWYRFYDANVPNTIEYPDETLPQMLDRVVARRPSAAATIFQGARLTYLALQEQTLRFAGGLRALGVEPGDRVALMLPNMPQFPVAFFGALRIGAIVVPTNPLYTRRELEHQLSDCGATTIVTLPQLLPQVLSAAGGTSIRSIVVADVGDSLPLHLRVPYRLKTYRNGPRRFSDPKLVPWREMVSGPKTRIETQCAPNDVAVLQYTGGTTGLAKGAMLSHRNLVTNATQTYLWQAGPRDEDVRSLCAAPFFHVYGLTVGMNLTIVAGGTMLLVPRFQPAMVRRVVRKYRPQLFPGVPTMYVALGSIPGVKPGEFSSLRACISGAAPLPPEVATRFREMTGAHVVEGYGLTEASPVTHCNPLQSARPGSVGVPFPDTDAAIVSPDSWEPAASGEIGELIVRGPQVMAGYWNRPEDTAAVLRNGWLRTGDLARQDDDGFFYIADRIKDVIIAGGYNVYPREVEDVLYSHPHVLEAAVVGVASDYRGESVKAFVVRQPGSTVSEDDITSYCRSQLAAFKVPKSVEFVGSLPKSLVGKVLRRELRATVHETDAPERNGAPPIPAGAEADKER